MRAIDADAFKNRLQCIAYDDWDNNILVCFSDACSKIIEMIEEEPTIDPPTQPDKKPLTFSERQKIVREYQDWCLFNNAADCAESFFAYLIIKGFIDG